MELVIYIAIALTVLVWIWMTFVGCYVVVHDETLNKFQRKAQICFVLLIPFFGSAFVLYLINLHSPDLIPKTMIPWPLKNLVFGETRKPNRNRDNNEENGIDLAISSRQSNYLESGGSSD